METKTIEITVIDRSSDFKAFLKASPGVWESGKTAEQALGKLFLSGQVIGLTIHLPPTEKE